MNSSRDKTPSPFTSIWNSVQSEKKRRSYKGLKVVYIDLFFLYMIYDQSVGLTCPVSVPKHGFFEDPIPVSPRHNLQMDPIYPPAQRHPEEKEFECF